MKLAPAIESRTMHVLLKPNRFQGLRRFAQVRGAHFKNLESVSELTSLFGAAAPPDEFFASK